MTVRRPANSFRRRLTLAFVLVAGLAAGALAVGAAIAVANTRQGTFAERARREASRSLALWPDDDPPSALLERLEIIEEPGAPGVVIIGRGGTTASSLDALTPDDVPPRLRRDLRAAEGGAAEQNVRVAGTPYLVVARAVPEHEADAFIFFSREELLQSLRELRITLLIGWAVVTAAAALFGTVVARRTLRPVREAADAAQAVTEGLLATRLPVGGHDEFAHWHAAFNTMVAALEDKLVALEAARDREQRFTADVAHELRTPLGSVVTASSLLAEAAPRLPADVRRPIEILVESADRLHRLVEELLELREIDAGQGLVNVDRIDLCDAVRSAVLAHGWERKVRVDAAGPVVLDVDRWRLDRILVNLVSNAVHHGAPPVIVTVGCTDGAVTVQVCDAGPGIPPSDLPHLFERYYKTSASRTPGSGGSGLGLSIAMENARLLGGRLEVRSELGRGAEFTLVLPVDGEDGS